MRTALALLAILTVACGSTPTSETSGRDSQTSPKLIPITTTSPEAREIVLKAIETMWHNRNVEAARQLEEALKLDPAFVQAQVLHAVAIGGAKGSAELEKAAAGAAGLPDAERLLVERAAAWANNDHAKARDAAVRLTELAPDDWRAFHELGITHLEEQQFGDAAQAFRRVIQLNPKVGIGHNMLGYALLEQGDLDGAIAAFTQYVSAAPTEANAQDSLADALMTAGRFEESEAAFRKALELDPQFYTAWEGIAYTKFFRRDWAAGRDALTKAIMSDAPPVERIALYRLQATAALAAGSPKEAIGALDKAAQIENLQVGDLTFLELFRARLLIDAGRPGEAHAIVKRALERADGGTLSPGLAGTARQRALLTQSLAESAAKDAVAAEKTARVLEADASAHPDDVNARSAATLSAAMAAAAKGDYSSARKRFADCLPSDYYCRYQQVAVTQLAGDRAAADSLRTALLKTYRRNNAYLLAWSRLNDMRRP